MRIFTLAAPLVLATTASAVDLTVTWTAPSTGSPVVEYEVYVTADGQAFFTGYTPDTSINLAVPDTPFVEYVAVVRGRDALDRAGPWSDPSEPFIVDFGPPGTPTGATITSP